jgi:hypothetical protein
MKHSTVFVCVFTKNKIINGDNPVDVLQDVVVSIYPAQHFIEE